MLKLVNTRIRIYLENRINSELITIKGHVAKPIILILYVRFAKIHERFI